MAATSELSTRERIVTEAMKLFAQRGYRGTSVGEIERAAGLSPRSGGLYKHFRRKEDVLAAGIERHVSEIEALRSMIELMPLGGDVRAELTMLGRWALKELGAEQDLMRVVQKDGDQFPALVAEVSERIVDRGHSEAVESLERILGPAVLGGSADAYAAVALASLVEYRIEERMFGKPPGGIGEEEFLEAWVDLWATFAEAVGAAGTKSKGNGRRRSEVKR